MKTSLKGSEQMHVSAQLDLSSDSSSIGEFDKQTLQDLQRTDSWMPHQIIDGQKGSRHVKNYLPSFEELEPRRVTVKDRLISNRLTLKSIPWSHQSTALNSKRNSNQEFSSSKKNPSSRDPDTKTCLPRRGLSHHRNSIGLLTSRYSGEPKSVSHMTHSENLDSRITARRESCDLSKPKVHLIPTKPLGLSSRRGSQLPFLSVKSMNSFVQDEGSKNRECSKIQSKLEIVIEPLGELSNIQSAPNHQVPLISRVPTKLMRIPQIDGWRSFMAKKIIQRPNPVVAHANGDTCGEQSLIPESAIDQKSLKNTVVAESTSPASPTKLRPSATLSSAGDTMFLNPQRNYLDESSIRLQSIKGSDNSIYRRKSHYLLAPAQSTRWASPDKLKSGVSNNRNMFSKLAPSGNLVPSSSHIDKSNVFIGNPPHFEVSRMQLVIPVALRPPSLRHTVLERDGTLTPNLSQNRKQPGTNTSDLHKSTVPGLDTIPDLEAIIQDCEAARRLLVPLASQQNRGLSPK